MSPKLSIALSILLILLAAGGIVFAFLQVGFSIMGIIVMAVILLFIAMLIYNIIWNVRRLKPKEE